MWMCDVWYIGCSHIECSHIECWSKRCRAVLLCSLHFGAWYRHTCSLWSVVSRPFSFSDYTVMAPFIAVCGVTTLFVLWLLFVGQVHKYVHSGPWHHHWKLFLFYYFTLFGVSCRDNLFNQHLLEETALRTYSKTIAICNICKKECRSHSFFQRLYFFFRFKMLIQSVYFGDCLWVYRYVSFLITICTYMSFSA